MSRRRSAWIAFECIVLLDTTHCRMSRLFQDGFEFLSKIQPWPFDIILVFGLLLPLVISRRVLIVLGRIRQFISA